MQKVAVEPMAGDTEDQSANSMARGPLVAGNGLSIWRVGQIAARYWRMTVCVTLGCAILAAVVAFVIPSQYTAVTTVMPPQQNTSLSSLLNSQMGGMNSLSSMAGKDLGLKDPNDVYIGLLESRTVEDALIEQFELGSVYHESKLSKIRRKLEKHAMILSTKAGFLSVSFDDRDPNRAARVANAYVSHLQNLMASLAVTEAGQRRKFFEQQLGDAQGKLVAADQRLKETQQKTGVIQLDAQMRASIESASELKARISAKEVEIQVLGSYATPENPDRIRAEEEAAGMRRQLALLESRQGTGEGDLQVATARMPAIGMAYLNLVRDVRYYETITELLAKQVEAARLDEARQGAVIQVLDKAQPPDTRSFPNRGLIVVLGALLGLVGTILFLAGREKFAAVINHMRTMGA